MTNTKMKTSIRGRIYTFRSLAKMYYPTVDEATASRYLRRLIHGDPLMMQDLSERGYQPKQRQLSIRQVSTIVEHLGLPEEFVEYTGA